MRLIIAYFVFVAALLVALPAFGAHHAKADSTKAQQSAAPQETSLPVSAERPIDVDFSII